MLLRNYDNIVAALSLVSYGENVGDISNFGDGYLTIKSDNAVLYKQFVGTTVSLPMSCLYYGNGGAGYSWIVLGSGNTPVTYDDYQVENTLLESQISVNQSSGISSTATYNEETKTWTKSRSYDFQAKSDVTVSEIGVYYFAPGVNRAFLVYREVLDTPVSLTTGQYLKVSITTTVSANPNKPANVSTTVETV